MSFLLPPLAPTFDAALRDVHAKAFELRVAAAERLAEPPGDPDRARAVTGLTTLASDADPRVRASALKSMTVLRDAALFDVLRGKLDDPHPAVRELAVVGLESIESVEALRALEDALTSPHAEVRFQAVVACVQRKPERDGAAIRALLDDDDERVRANAARAFARLTPFPPPDALFPSLDDAYAEVRYEAALALAALGSNRGASELLRALEEPDRVLDALDALGGFGELATREPIVRLTTNLFRPLTTKVAAARALLRLGDAHGVVALREVLRALRSDGRAFAVEVALELNVTALIPDLERLSERPRGVDPERVREALARLKA